VSKYQKGDEFSLGPSLCGSHVPYVQYREGQMIGMGVAELGFDPDKDRGREMISLSDPNEHGRQRVDGTFRTNAPGSAAPITTSVRTGAATPAYRSGWEQTFAARRKASAPS
jgi:hypothetical protein